jgi:hypothetical protein
MIEVKIKDVEQIEVIKSQLAQARKIKQDLSFHRFLNVDVAYTIQALENELARAEGESKCH